MAVAGFRKPVYLWKGASAMDELRQRLAELGEHVSDIMARL